MRVKSYKNGTKRVTFDTSKREKLREEMCPEHKGEWNGQAMLDGCKHGCHGTGWLSSVPVDKSVTPIMIATVRDGVVLDISPPEGSLDAPVGSPDPPKT